MTDTLSGTVGAGFSRYLRDFGQRVHAVADQLSEEQFWTKPYPYGNSMGHLVLHLTGNLRHFIGAGIAGTGYVRDRDREFTDSGRAPKHEVLAQLDETIEMVADTLGKQTAADWTAPYRATGADDTDRFSIVLRCVAHFQHHVGQMLYLAKEHARQQSESGASRH